MNKKIMGAILVLHAKGLDYSVDAETPYWTELLDDEYADGSTDYSAIIAFLKGMGYRIYRNTHGKHMLVHQSEQKEV